MVDYTCAIAKLLVVHRAGRIGYIRPDEWHTLEIVVIILAPLAVVVQHELNVEVGPVQLLIKQMQNRLVQIVFVAAPAMFPNYRKPHVDEVEGSNANANSFILTRPS